MEKKHYKLSDFVVAPSSSMIDPQSSSYDRFVGLEHYDTRVPVISRYSGKDILSSTVKEFRQGDLLIARRNVYLERAGIALFDGITSGDSIILRVKNNCEDATGVPVKLAKRILPFVLNSNSFWSFANRHADGMNSKRISKDKLLEFEFSLPSVKEQESLSEKLWVAYELKQSYIKMIEATDEMVKSQFIEMFGDPVTNSKGWPTKPISEVAPETPSKHSIEGVVWNLNLDMVESNSGQVISKVYDDVKNLLSVAQFDEGNVLFSKLRPYLNKVVTPDEIGYATTELVPLRPKEDEINKYFLAHLLRSDIFVAYANAIATGTKMPRMPMNSLRSFECILPPMDMQMKFVAIADQADKSKFELKKSIAAIDKVIKSLINENI